jgi:myosin heavy subunit
MQGQIYTYIGDILLAVNPFTQLGIYNDEVCYYYYYFNSGNLVQFVFFLVVEEVSKQP